MPGAGTLEIAGGPGQGGRFARRLWVLMKAAAAGGQRHLSEAPAHLDIAPQAMNLLFHIFHFAQELGDRPDQAGVDIDLRMLLLGELKEGFGGGYGHGANPQLPAIDGEFAREK